MKQTDKRVKLLLDVKEVFDKNGIFFFPMWGTLLGFVRDGKIMDYDNDIDLGLWVKDWAKVKNTFKELDSMGYGSQYKYGNTKYSRIRIFIKLNKNNEYIGIKKSTEGIADFTVSVNFFNMVGNKICINDRRSYRSCFPYAGFKKIKIYGKYFNIPANDVEFCRLMYGDTWRTPMEGWRHPDIYDHPWYKKKWIFRFIEDRWRDITNWRQVGLKKVFKFW